MPGECFCTVYVIDVEPLQYQFLHAGSCVGLNLLDNDFWRTRYGSPFRPYRFESGFERQGCEFGFPFACWLHAPGEHLIRRAEEAKSRHGTPQIPRMTTLLCQKGVEGRGAFAKNVWSHERAVPDIGEAGR